MARQDFMKYLNQNSGAQLKFFKKHADEKVIKYCQQVDMKIKIINELRSQTSFGIEQKMQGKQPKRFNFTAGKDIMAQFKAV